MDYKYFCLAAVRPVKRVTFAAKANRDRVAPDDGSVLAPVAEHPRQTERDHRAAQAYERHASDGGRVGSQIRNVTVAAGCHRSRPAPASHPCINWRENGATSAREPAHAAFFFS